MNAFVVKQSDIDACPRRVLLPSHYHVTDDGTVSCGCERPRPERTRRAKRRWRR